MRKVPKNQIYLLNCLRKIPMFIPRLESRMVTWSRHMNRYSERESRGQFEVETYTRHPASHTHTHTSSFVSLNERLVAPPLVGVALASD